ncbi:class I SAM-dependent methyltransferase [Actinomadura graeca]|uniref:Class I SAM-dependent methyltransferase n=1 Tax=Actinomadura graeca TaxID=2750812 RepID=A0ABX8QSU5_9ACTN|nr:class I SAM-dependent methyltransferase [Actinomadura graeca]QXJ21812.1 class I SAM-dependent methyltransferase [Actinomadura graeca]
MRPIANTHHAEAWNGWEGVHRAQNAGRYNAIVNAFNDDLLHAAAITPGDQVLDVGCGTGHVTLLAARCASDGQVVGVDLSLPMLERARADAAEQGIANARFEQGDAQVHPFPEGGFDVAISRGGCLFFEDPVAAFANILFGLRPGGRLAFLVPQAGTSDSPIACATAALKPLLREPAPTARGMDSLLDPARIREVLGAAGFADVTIAAVQAPMHFGQDAEDATEFIFSQGAVRLNLQSVDQAVAEQTRNELRDGLLAFETPEGVLIPGDVWLVSAVRP